MLQDSLLFAAPASLAAALLALVFGLLIGSFLNVVIYRVPKMIERETDNYVVEYMGEDMPRIARFRHLPHTDRFNLSLPRSKCPHCGHQITALENIPVLSYLALRGKCSACKAPISPRYPLIELATGLISFGLIWHFGGGVKGMAALFFAYSLIAMTFIDFDTQLLPDSLTYPLLAAGLLLNLDATQVPLRDAVLGAIAGYLILWLINLLYKLVRKTDGMGGGDFVLLGALGAWFGWAMLPVIILLSSAVGAVVGMCLILFRGHGRNVPIPFGPYLAGAGMIALVWGEQLARWTSGVLH